MQVGLRIRPLIETEISTAEQMAWSHTDTGVTEEAEEGDPLRGAVFAFDHVYGPDRNNDDVYADLA